MIAVHHLKVATILHWEFQTSLGYRSIDLTIQVLLTGRKYTLRLYPISQMELSQIEKPHETRAHIESRLIYGSYPEIIVIKDNSIRKRYLRELVGYYLLKDILTLEGIRQSDKLLRLLQLLAFQIGKDVSLNELGNHLSMSKNTISRYLELLEKVFAF